MVAASEVCQNGTCTVFPEPLCRTTDHRWVSVNCYRRSSYGKSGREDLNLRPHGPEARGLTRQEAMNPLTTKHLTPTLAQLQDQAKHRTPWQRKAVVGARSE